MVTVAEALDAGTLLDQMLAASDRAVRLLEAGGLSQDELVLVSTIREEAERLIDLVGDVLDSQEASDALAEARREGTVPWEKVRDWFVS